MRVIDLREKLVKAREEAAILSGLLANARDEIICLQIRIALEEQADASHADEPLPSICRGPEWLDAVNDQDFPVGLPDALAEPVAFG